MRVYLVKRLLLMIPTFLGITLIVFAVLNLAPGRPGARQQGIDIAKDIRGEQSEESHRIFREQFHLDKPVMLNTLFALESSALEAPLEVLLGRAEADAARRLAAREELDAYGGYAVPHLVAIVRRADESGDEALRDLAVFFLQRAARRPLVDPYKPDPSPELRARNREIGIENAA